MTKTQLQVRGQVLYQEVNTTSPPLPTSTSKVSWGLLSFQKGHAATAFITLFSPILFHACVMDVHVFVFLIVFLYSLMFVGEKSMSILTTN